MCRPSRAVLLFSLLSLCLGVGSAVAQENADRRVAVIDFTPLTNASSAYSQICSDTLSIELERVGYTLIPGDAVRLAFQGSALDTPAVIKAARAIGADVVVVGFYVIEGNTIFIGVRAIDTKSEAVAISTEESGAAGFEVFDTIDMIAADVARRIQQALKPVQKADVVIEREDVRVETTVVEEIVELGTPLTLILRSRDEGAVVYADDIELGTIADGILEIHTKEGSLLALTLRKDGFHDRSVEFTASDEKPDIKARPLVRKGSPELAVRTALDRPFGLDAAVRWFFLDDTLTAEAGGGLFFIPFQYPEFLSFGQSALISEPGGSFTLSLAGGGKVYPMAFLQPGRPVQPYLSLDLVADILLTTSPSGAPLSLIAIARGGSAMGLRWILKNFSLSADIQVLSPVFLNLGGLAGAESQPVVRLRLEVALPW